MFSINLCTVRCKSQRVDTASPLCRRLNDPTTWPSSLSPCCRRRFRSPETIGIMTRHHHCRRRCRRYPRRRHPRRDASVLDRVDTGGGYWHFAGPPGLFTYKLYKYYFRANRPVDHYETPGGKFQRILLVPHFYLPFLYTYNTYVYRTLVVTLNPLNLRTIVP